MICLCGNLRFKFYLQLQIYTTKKFTPKSEKDLTHVLTIEQLNVSETFER